MSHFTVMVCVSPESLAQHGGVYEAVEAMMAPYQENNMGDCPQEYMEFNEIETEYLEEYNTQSRDMVKLPGGEVCSRYDDRFYDRTELFNTKGPNYPEGHEMLEIPFKECYSSFEEFMEDYHGCESRDEKTGKYGYWENPNRKWDYWRIGGRWSGHFRVKPGTEIAVTKGSWDSPPEIEENTTDICRIADLDLPRIEAEMRERAEKFWNEFAEFRKTGKVPPEDDAFYNIRSRAMDVGLLEVVEDPEEGKRRGGFLWADTMKNLREDDKRRDWYDVVNQEITKEEFLNEWSGHYCPIRTYAALDENGWFEPGRMGWFGCSSADSESRNEYGKVFMEKFIYEKDPETILVVCDCHI